MAIRLRGGALMFSTLLLAGCGTVSNLAHPRIEEGGRNPFGGVRQDIACYNAAKNGEIGLKGQSKPDSGQHPRVALMCLCAADMPFSLVGDLVTWPYTAAYTYINQPVPYPAMVQGPQTPIQPVSALPTDPKVESLAPAPTPVPDPTPVPAPTPAPAPLPVNPKLDSPRLKTERPSPSVLPPIKTDPGR